MIDKSLSRGLADRILEEMSRSSELYGQRLGQALGGIPRKRHAVEHIARDLGAAGEACRLTQVLGRHPKWRWVSSCAFLPHVHPREHGVERVMTLVAIRTYSHVDRLSLVDADPPTILSISEHALERLFQRLNVFDAAAVREELHDATCMAVHLLNAARHARLLQAVLPTRSGAFLCTLEPIGLVAKTWIANSEDACRHTEPIRLARHYFDEAGGEQGLGAEIGALPIDAPLTLIEPPHGLTRGLTSIAWLQEPYSRRADPVGDTWQKARTQQQLNTHSLTFGGNA